MTPEPFCSADGYHQYHVVQAGESLWRIAEVYFGSSSAPGTQAAVDHLLRWNPQIQRPDHILPGDLLIVRMPIEISFPSKWPLTPSQEAREVMTAWNGIPRRERRVIAEVGPLLNRVGVGLLGGGGGLAAFELLVRSNLPELRSVVTKYEEYRAGQITKGQYDYFRRLRLERIRERFGPVSRSLFGGRSPREAFRIKPGGGATATRPMIAEISRLRRVGQMASRGGVVLGVAGLGVACYEIARTNDESAKNLIAVEALAGTAIGTGAGIVAGIFLASNPLGWGVALAVGAGSALTGYVGGKGAGFLYKMTGEPVRVVDTLGIDHVCR